MSPSCPCSDELKLLGIIFGGLLSVLLWFEVSDTSAKMDPHERTAFILAGLVETLLFIASALGFVGAIVRKQLFIQAYAYFIYIHFVVNIAVAGFFLYVVSHFSSTAINKACVDTVKDSGAENQCSGLLSDLRTVYIVVVIVILVIELYGALILARYVHQIKTEKSTARTSRMKLLDRASRGRGFDVSGQYSRLSANQTDDVSLIPKSYPEAEFNPYDNSEHPGSFPHNPHTQPPSLYDAASAYEEGYGGGSWTHEQISRDEKSMLQEQDPVVHRTSFLVDERPRSDVKTAAGPSPEPESHDIDPLPRYLPPASERR
ncbi:hypothetical protein D9757_000626 [Collybiopsis confluens]|uniref:Uncharacterized protein n=1 Tax=Collybiopsis confluens TaxID=2823264 RepID=A0A8H5MGN2_9AGAR|nr:hypothetical protein D9757_000626 [Collybiopsis confluens]